MKRTYLFAMAAIVLVSTVASAKMPKGSFLNSPVNGTEQLARQVTDDAIVAARYAKHFGMSRDYVVAYFQGNLAIGKLKSDYETTIYRIKGRTDAVAEQTVLAAGTYVFLSTDGEPILEASSGDPVAMNLPLKVSNKPKPASSTLVPGTGSEDVVTKVLGSAPIEAGTPALGTTAAADAVVPMGIPAAASTFPAVEIVGSIPAAGGGSGAALLLPLALLGALGGGGGGGSSAPQPASVPEPSSLMMIAMGVAGAGFAGFRKRR